MSNSRINTKIKREGGDTARLISGLNNLSPTNVNALIAQYFIDNPVGGKLVSIEGGQIPSGGTGTLLTRTAASGKYFKVVYLLATSTGGAGQIVFTSDGVDTLTGTLAGTTPTAPASSIFFGIAQGYGSATPSDGARILKEVYCNSFSVSAAGPVLGTPIDYVYEILEAL